MLNNSLYGQAFCKVIMFFPSSIQTVSEISQKVEYVIIKTYDSMFLCNRQCKRNLVWSISLPIHNKLHSKIVKHVLSLQYSNVNFASFMYCCAANKYDHSLCLCFTKDSFNSVCNPNQNTWEVVNIRINSSSF